MTADTIAGMDVNVVSGLLVDWWVRVSSRGRWHAVSGQRRATGAWETACGRVYPLDAVSTVAVGARPGAQCEKCKANR